ncbi:MAG: hypothetical protein ACLP1X_06025 [Polyangiaceae bacterium]
MSALLPELDPPLDDEEPVLLLPELAPLELPLAGAPLPPDPDP